MKRIIAILGLAGSGKTESIEYLMKKNSWPKVYFGDVTFDEMKARGLEINEKNERIVREDLREKYGNLHYAKKVVEKIRAMDDDNILVESLYSWEEYLAFKKEFGDDFVTIAIHSAPRYRYQRLGKRSIRPLTASEAQSRDYSQIENLHQAGPIAMADFIISNNNEGLETLHGQIDEVMGKIMA